MSNRIPPDAFDFYASIGAERTHAKVAEEYDVSVRAVSKCASRENWTERLEKIDRDSRERTDKRLGETLDDIRVRHLKTLRVMNARAVEALKQYPLSSAMEAMKAAEVVIKLERLIIGEPTERNAMSVEEITREEIRSLLVVVGGGEDTDDADDDEGKDDGDTDDHQDVG